ncbi:Hypothetical predicted protein [Mytilus galloprovincialis]|uniref:Uncharacterized protein n=1 Tax=Mytilus galloprovincialis TaxID=29158 RepID=A0A8B6CRU6_MYTGA|nr:Hypothetical predicted protein [Mytilus galloprovincialis]
MLEASTETGYTYDDDKSSDEEDYYTNLWKTNLKIDPVIFRKSKKHVNAKIKEIQELSGPLYKTATKSKDDDTLSDGKDFCTTLRKPDMEIRRKAKTQIKTKIKQINKSDRLCKKAATKAKVSKRNAKACVSKDDDRGSDEEDYYTNLWKTNLKIDPVIFQRSKKHVDSKIKEIQELSGPLYKTATKSKDDDTLSDGKDFCTTLRKPDMEIRRKAKTQIKSKIKQINKSDRLCKKAATKVERYAFDS